MSRLPLLPEEETLARLIVQMERLRAAAAATGDVLQASEVAAWFKEHAATIRRIRDLTEDFD